MSTVFSAKVKGGVIVAEDIELPEGATVTVVLDEDRHAPRTPADPRFFA